VTSVAPSKSGLYFAYGDGVVAWAPSSLEPRSPAVILNPYTDPALPISGLWTKLLRLDEHFCPDPQRRACTALLIGTTGSLDFTDVRFGLWLSDGEGSNAKRLEGFQYSVFSMALAPWKGTGAPSLLVGSPGGGLWASDDVGVTWRPFQEGLVASDALGIAVAPSPTANTSIVVASTVGIAQLVSMLELNTPPESPSPSLVDPPVHGNFTVTASVAPRSSYPFAPYSLALPDSTDASAAGWALAGGFNTNGQAGPALVAIPVGDTVPPADEGDSNLPRFYARGSNQDQDHYQDRSPYPLVRQSMQGGRVEWKNATFAVMSASSYENCTTPPSTS